MPEDLPTSAPEPAPLPPYGPPVPPPPGRTSPWVWVALATGIVALLVSVGSAILPIFMFALEDFEGREFDESGVGYYVEQNSVINAVEEPCEAMIAAAEKIRLGGTPEDAASSLRAWATTAQAIVTAIDAADPNADSKAWRDDWKATIAAVDKYADNIGKPKNRLSLPGGVEDMFWETDADCGVPIAIAGLDPDKAGSMFGE